MDLQSLLYKKYLQITIGNFFKLVVIWEILTANFSQRIVNEYLYKIYVDLLIFWLSKTATLITKKKDICN